MENSPIIIALAQVIILIGQAVAYLRSKQDVARNRTDMGVVMLDARSAKDTADQAKHAVEKVEVEHYRSLRAKYEEVLTDLVEARAKIASLKAEVESLRETITTVNNKLASREKVERRAAKTAEKEDQELPTASGDAGVDDLVKNGMAIPLFQTAAPAAQARPGFGRTMKGGR